MGYLLVLIIALIPLTGHAEEQSIKQAHKPPILTTTAIIEIHESEQFKGIVLIERGKAPFGKAIPGGKVEYGETVENVNDLYLNLIICKILSASVSKIGFLRKSRFLN
ncbi:MULTISPECIES: NUDIX hydrolase [Parachlamydia]|uniref:NUDIX hydrolase n=1 Tax=Parachlamydia TaxID=83551 RepID=UPI00117FC405|nr:NUDIX hydrolase [Parachlamydia acanthamoebae]